MLGLLNEAGERVAGRGLAASSLPKNGGIRSALRAAGSWRVETGAFSFRSGERLAQ